MTRKADIRAEAERLRAVFEARGAEVFEADILQHAGALLDLYGEDIRARAFVTHDPSEGEMMLRPDFTVPLVERHTGSDRTQARYTYAGEVFRSQEENPDRASEYMQVGYEILGEDPAEADAEVLSSFLDVLAPFGLRAAMGDIGLLRAAVTGLQTSEARKAALMRHLWRPARFKALLTRYSQPPRPVPEMGSGVEIGLRDRTEVEARIARLREDSAVAPLSGEEIALLDTLLSIRGNALGALEQLRDLAVDLPAIARAVAALDARYAALAARGVDLASFAFETSYGRTTLEYYDGFVFGFTAPNRPDLPPVATGGRYDALTRAIGGGAGTPAVGGVIRPGLLLQLAEATA